MIYRSGYICCGLYFTQKISFYYFISINLQNENNLFFFTNDLNNIERFDALWID